MPLLRLMGGAAMDKFAYAPTQTIVASGYALLTPTDCCCCCDNAVRQTATGVIRLSGRCGRAITQYHVMFDANVAIPADGTAGAITLGLTLDGVTLPGSIATVTPAAVGDLWHISVNELVNVSCGDAVTIAVQNLSGVEIEMRNAVLIV